MFLSIVSFFKTAKGIAYTVFIALIVGACFYMYYSYKNMQNTLHVKDLTIQSLESNLTVQKKFYEDKLKTEKFKIKFETKKDDLQKEINTYKERVDANISENNISDVVYFAL